ncbi:hypothetical protein AvCA_37510 [Azotobacter vinelandii CA]|uniref:Uncharacterized protein n=3 Tax=Azotobacter group TaxID=351 RepID=C1DS21_AZOVD|nr:hypothetical protein Avin_37510 [Azotobacter vinelandii DJ]AGK16169.1 hypothetical protein AvCA_37510 [Azotobacter vinelandii CA]AGK21580.1 hypothetical protein AvCA6_37510 [Azotobacter vinelandii CA6]
MRSAMDQIAENIDRLEDLIAALHTPMPHRLHIRCLCEALPEVVAGLRAGYLAAGGDNHWHQESL